MNRLLQYLKPSYPPVALLWDPPHLQAIRVDKVGRSAAIQVRHQEDIEEAPDGSLSLEGLSGDRLDSILVRLGDPKKISLVLSDAFFRTQIVKLTEFPRSEEERIQVLRWHVRKILDYPVEACRMRYVVLRKDPSAFTVLVTTIPEEAIGSLERAFEEKGCQLGYVGLETLELYHTALSRDMFTAEGVSLLLNRTKEGLGFLFVETGSPFFYRYRYLSYVDDEDPDRVAQEIRLTLAFHRERNAASPVRRLIVRCWPPEKALDLEPAVTDEEIVHMDQVRPPLAEDAFRRSAALPLANLLVGH